MIALSLIELLAQLFGADFARGWGASAKSGVHGALAWLVAASGLLCVDPASGPIALLCAVGPTGIVTRRALPAAVLLPIAIGALHAGLAGLGVADRAFLAAASMVPAMSAFDASSPPSSTSVVGAASISLALRIFSASTRVPLPSGPLEVTSRSARIS